MTGVLFAGGDDFLVIIGDDARALVWDVERRAVGETLAGHPGRVLAAAADKSRRTLHTGGLDSRVITWDLAGDRRLGRPFDAGAGVGVTGNFFPATAISADGRTLVTAHRGGVSLIDTAMFTRRSVPVPGGSPEVNAPAFAADGFVAVAGLDGFLALVDERTRRPPPQCGGTETSSSHRPAPPAGAGSSPRASTRRCGSETGAAAERSRRRSASTARLAPTPRLPPTAARSPCRSSEERSTSSTS